jgi:hypothetical protein
MAAIFKLTLLFILCLAARAQQQFDLDISENVLMPVHGFAKLRISANVNSGLTWIPSRYEHYLVFDSMLGEFITKDEHSDYQVFVARCNEMCKVGHTFVFSMKRTMGNYFAPPQEHAVFVRVIDE